MPPRPVLRTNPNQNCSILNLGTELLDDLQLVRFWLTCSTHAFQCLRRVETSSSPAIARPPIIPERENHLPYIGVASFPPLYALTPPRKPPSPHRRRMPRPADVFPSHPSFRLFHPSSSTSGDSTRTLFSDLKLASKIHHVREI